MTSYFIREHQFVNHDTGTRCLHCNSFTTIGDYCIVTCNLRFNENGFREYLNFINVGVTVVHERVKSKKAIAFKSREVYTRRYSSKSFTRRQLMQKFKSVIDIEATLKVINQPVSMTQPNM